MSGRAGGGGARRIAVVLVVAALVVMLALALRSGLRGLDVSSNGPRSPRLDENLTREPVPDFGPTPSIEERRAFWHLMLTTGDEADAEWSLAQIERGGAEARAELMAAARRALRSNPALVQRALDVAISDPRPDDLAVARDALDSTSDQVLLRVATLLRALGPDARGTESALGRLARRQSMHVPRAAYGALAAIGTDDAVREIVAACDATSTQYRPWGYVALGAIGSDEALAALRGLFESLPENDVVGRAAVAEALMRCGDRRGLPWVGERLATVGNGSDEGERMLRTLAEARDSRARELLVRRATDPFETADRREEAVHLLRKLPIEEVDEALWFASRHQPAGANEPTPPEVRLSALETRVLMGAPGAKSELVKLLTSASGTGDREVAAKVVGRLRRPDLAPAVAAALEATAFRDERLRSWMTRALTLSGDPRFAPQIVAEMVRDRGGFGSGGPAFEIWTGLAGANEALGRAVVVAAERALRATGEDAPGGSGLQHLLLVLRWGGRRESADVVARFLLSDVREIRDAALDAYETVAKPNALGPLRRLWARPLDELQREELRIAMRKIHHAAE